MSSLTRQDNRRTDQSIKHTGILDQTGKQNRERRKTDGEILGAGGKM